ncbi:Ig-like domain-containing protein [Nakamurella sp. GG22]
MPSSNLATERHRSASKHLMVGVLVPAVVALVAFAAPAAAAPVATVPTGSVLVSESFTGATVSDGSWRALGDGCLTRATAAPVSASSLGACALRVGSPSVKSQTGYLQLTDATANRKGGAVYTKPSASALGLDVTFDQWQYGTANYGGDGLSFFLADGAAGITAPGGPGSSLGYAQNTNMPTAPNGIAGAYLGVGLDAHGAFASSGDGHGTGCATRESAAFQANSVVLRGPGSGKSGYCYLASTNLSTASQKLHLTVADPSVVTPAMARTFRVTVSPGRFPTVTVYAAFSPDADLKQVLQYTMTDAAPATYQFGFTAASGSVVGTHLIGNLSAATVTPIKTTPSITVNGGATAFTNQAKPTISGTSTAVAGRTATVSVGGQNLTSLISPTGGWSVVPTTLTQGSHQVVVKVSASNGATVTSSQTLTVDTIPPAVVINGGSAVSTQSATPTISGRVNVAAGSKIKVAVDGITSDVVVSSTRTWSVTSTRLTAGVHSVVVSATDPAGNVGTQKQRLTVIPVLSIDGGVARLTRDAAPTISGRTDAPSGTVITVLVAGQTLTGTVTAAGAWSVTSRSLQSTTYTVKATVRDAAGNLRTAWQKLTVDTIAPSIVINGGSVASTKTTTPTISGRVNVPAGSIMSVAVDGIPRAVVVSSTRTWSVAWPTLKAGAHTVAVSATDAAGNVRTQKQRLTVIG